MDFKQQVSDVPKIKVNNTYLDICLRAWSQTLTHYKPVQGQVACSSASYYSCQACWTIFSVTLKSLQKFLHYNSLLGNFLNLPLTGYEISD